MGDWNNDQRQLKKTLTKLRLDKFIIVSFFVWNYIGTVSCENFTRSSRDARTFPNLFKTSKYVSFNSVNDKIGIDLDLSIPFLSIPLDTKYGSMGSLININARALTIAGIFTIVSTIIAPLLSNTPEGPHYRMDDAADQDWWNHGEILKQVLLGNSYLAPCTKKFICMVVSSAYHADGQTSFDKIIDGISSHEWFDQMMDGTAVHEAILAARKSKDNCNVVYSGCLLPKKLFGSFPDISFPL